MLKQQIIDMEQPLNLHPTEELVRLTATEAGCAKRNVYATVVGLISEAATLNGCANMKRLDLRRYAYSYSIGTVCRNRKGTWRLRLQFKGRSPEGKVIAFDIPPQMVRDLVHIERVFPRGDIYPVHLPPVSRWPTIWKARRCLTKYLMHLEYKNGYLAHIKLQDGDLKIQRTVHKKLAEAQFPNCVPEEAYLRYSEYYYNKRMTAKQRAAARKELVR